MLETRSWRLESQNMDYSDKPLSEHSLTRTRKQASTYNSSTTKGNHGRVGSEASRDARILLDLLETYC